MARENSFSDEGRSLTPDLDDRDPGEVQQDDAQHRPQTVPVQISASATVGHDHHPAARSQPTRSSSASRSLRNRISFNKHPQSAPLPRLSMDPPPAARFATPSDRFRSVVNRVMAMRRTSYMLSGAIAGAEPGVDPRRATAYEQYRHVRQKCAIDVVDYSPLRTITSRMGNAELVKFLGDQKASERPPWVKVRWINVGGISWDVISALALKYDMHPLAIEDLLHQSNRSRSKADYYAQHLFLRVLCHTVGSSSDTDDEHAPPVANPATSAWSSRANTLTGMPRSASPSPLDEKKEIDVDEQEHDVPELTDDHAPYDLEAAAPRSNSLLARKRKSHVAQLTLDELKRGDRVNVRISPMCIFLYRDGTVISFVNEPSLDFTEPIASRLRQRDSTLRRTGDPSLLVESLLDIIVDRALEVVEEYHRRIQILERNVLIQPKVKSVRALHILSGDLTLHKRTMDPIRTLIYGLRRYDVDRYVAVQQPSSGENTEARTGYMSHKSNIYLADVHDHIEYALASLDMYAALTENLISYTFNMASYDMNDSMRSLTTVTIIFFPLTLLTGYFGMNFTGFWSINNNSDLFFWELAIPLMCVVIPIFLWSDIVRAVHYAKKKLLARDIRKSVQHASPPRHRAS